MVIFYLCRGESRMYGFRRGLENLFYMSVLANRKDVPNL